MLSIPNLFTSWMALVPTSAVGRVIAVAWLSGVRWNALVRLGATRIHDMPIAFIWLMVFLTMPIGLPVAMVVGMATSTISAALGIKYHACHICGANFVAREEPSNNTFERTVKQRGFVSQRRAAAQRGR